MRRNPKSLVWLFGIAVGLAALRLASSQPVASKEPATSTKVKELQKKRLAVLQSIYDLTKTGYENGVTSYDHIRTAKSDLLSARLDYAETKKERLQICDEAVADAKAWQKLVQEGVKAQAYSKFDELKAESDLLEAQITRENTADDDE